MPKIQDTIKRIVEAESWDQRIAQLRLIPMNFGTNQHPSIYAEIARVLYVPHLAADFAYIHEDYFYGQEYFERVYTATHEATDGFIKVSEAELTSILKDNPRTLLIFRTITGLRKAEFAHATIMAGEPIGLPPLSSNKVDAMERKGTSTTNDQAKVAAKTICQIIDGSLFGIPPGDLISKHAKADTKDGWLSVRSFASAGVPFGLFLHQRHYGGSFRQVLDATSTKRGNLIEDAVEALFKDNGVPYIRTGSHNQGDIATLFEVRVTPAPDFVIFDNSQTLRAILECKGTNDGGTARDKASRFTNLRGESNRLGGVPLIAVLGGIGWARVNDALGPVVRDTDGRVFALSTLSAMLEMAPFPSLIGLTSA
ncbi:MAG: hypothetical protein M1438_07380 [Deltaproteobacteria bacterium]|nr:hypothetical protein [Deltaproteobacteria bacterium]